MLIDLSTYLDELKAEKNGIEVADYEENIKELVVAYEAKVRAEFAEEKASKLKEKEIEIDVLERIVAREAKKEEEKAHVVEIDNIAPVEPETSAVSTEIFADTVVSSVEENQSENNDFADL